MSEKALFIAIEGGDGVGKSYFIRHFCDFLKNSKISYLSTREPGGTFLAEEIRKLFATSQEVENLSKETELLLLSAARSQHVALRIKPTLEKGTWVICDRFVESTFVYQGIVGGLDEKIIADISSFATSGLLPHVTFLLHCNEEVSNKRRSERTVTEKIQTASATKDDPSNTDEHAIARYDSAGEDFHQKIREGFLKRSQNNPHYLVIDSSKNVLDQIEIAKKHLEEKFSVSFK